MATAPQVLSLDDYLHTEYRPDCDFVDGQLDERHLGERDHNRLQLLLSAWFLAHEQEWGIYCLPEQRTRVAGTRVRIPDVCLLRADVPREQVLVRPPLLCIEILSPEDRLARVARRLDDFLAMGVQHLWIIDPARQEAYRHTAAGPQLQTGDRLSIPGTPIFVDLQRLFASFS